MLKKYVMNFPKNIFNFSDKKMPTPNMEHLDLRDPDKATNNILSFLQSQSEIAEKQFKISRNLIFATIIIMILQVCFAFWFNYSNHNKQSELIKLIEIQSKQTEAISQMSLSLLDLQNQVQNLEKQNEVLSKK
jgi:hypothetical protein